MQVIEIKIKPILYDFKVSSAPWGRLCPFISQLHEEMDSHFGSEFEKFIQTFLYTHSITLNLHRIVYCFKTIVFILSCMPLNHCCKISWYGIIISPDEQTEIRRGVVQLRLDMLTMVEAEREIKLSGI